MKKNILRIANKTYSGFYREKKELIAEKDRMKTKNSNQKINFECPHCKGHNFICFGIQRQKGLFRNRELWNCRNCRSTFARETLEVDKTADNETFHKKALPFYARLKFSSYTTGKA